MKKTIAIIIVAALILAAAPAYAGGMRAQTARTTLLDLSNPTTSTSNSSQGWSFDPHGADGDPLLTLNSYGNSSQHSAPIKLPRSTTIVVNGTCYVDNIYMNEPYPVISAPADGDLIIRGSGVLNLYAEEYRGRCIELSGAYGENEIQERLYINDLTVNCFSIQPDRYTAFSNEPCIYANSGIYVNNATVNTRFGKAGLWTYGYTPIGGVSEETAEEIVINNSNVSIYNVVAEQDGWQYANGIHTTFGKIRITGSSNVNIVGGSQCIYCYLSCVIEGSTVNITSTPVSTADAFSALYVGSLHLKNTMGSIDFHTTRYIGSRIVYCRDEYESTCENGVELLIGTFENGNYAAAPDPDNNNLPALKAVGSGQIWSGVMGDVDNSGSVTIEDALMLLRYSLGLINSLPAMPAADVTGDGTIDISDALKVLRISLGLI